MKQRLLIPFAIAVFLSAALVFLVQPLLAKQLLPRFGGAPAVWNTCMVFFQATLLIGYCYTWLSTKWLSPQRQIAVHFCVLLATVFFLPLALPEAETFAAWHPVWGLIATLLVTLGGPYFAVCTTTPLIQQWFSGVHHKRSADPYFLYAVSNAGSFVGLLAYPFAVELVFDAPTQRSVWTCGYVGLMVLTLLCGCLRFRAPAENAASKDANADSRTDSASRGKSISEVSDLPVNRARRARWVLLAFVPSALMLGVTTRITTDVASGPLFWVIPLAIYLASFIHAFARRRLISVARLEPLLFPTLCVVAFCAQLSPGNMLRAFADICMFVLSGLLFHGKLADDRPSTKYLTEYYFWLAVGGCLGGTLVALIAPIVFPANWEFPLTLIVAASLGTFVELHRGKLRSAITILGLVLFAGLSITARWLDVQESALISVLLMLGYLATAIFFWRRQHRNFVISLAFCVLPAVVLPAETSIFRTRSFFGTIEVREEFQGNVTIHRLVHGTTTHGEQVSDSEQLQCSPLGYYGPTSPIGDAFTYLSSDVVRRVGVIGLGAGAVHCYSRPNEKFDYYEIDPTIRDIAQDSKYFTYLKCGAGQATVSVGDGRLLVGKEADESFDILLLDAFGSDSVPVHLLTAEALDVFISKLKPDGVLIVHISNRMLDLQPVLGKYAQSRKLECLARDQNQLTQVEQMRGQALTHAVALARTAKALRPLQKLNNTLRSTTPWRRPRVARALWTDQHSSILAHSRILERIAYALSLR